MNLFRIWKILDYTVDCDVYDGESSISIYSSKRWDERVSQKSPHPLTHIFCHAYTSNTNHTKIPCPSISLERFSSDKNGHVKKRAK
mmetsp:Transcript_22177/g.28485  ORF Transcript_22177/g.28485 Transcript_22177/m.28485 type:complete len:86 (+) Transcript_22177:1917-2174(+)